MSEEEKEIITEGSIFGYYPPTTTRFSDLKSLGNDPFKYSPTGLKVFFTTKGSEKVINGIQFFYKNLGDGKEFTPGQNAEKFEYYEELKLEKGEYLTRYNATWDTKINEIIFETSKGKNYTFGEKKGTTMFFESNGKDSMIIGSVGNYTDTLNSLGVYYADLMEYYKKMTIGYFELRKIVKNKQKWEEKRKTLKLSEKDEVLVRVCELPDGVFSGIISYCLK